MEPWKVSTNFTSQASARPLIVKSLMTRGIVTIVWFHVSANSRSSYTPRAAGRWTVGLVDFLFGSQSLLTLRAHSRSHSCARSDLNLLASNYAAIFPNQSSFTGACWLRVRSRAPKTRVRRDVTRLEILWSSVSIGDPLVLVVSPLKLPSWTLWIGLKGIYTNWTGGLVFFERYFSAVVGPGAAVKRAGKDENKERRGAWLIFYLRGDLASRARILAFIDPDNHSPLQARCAFELCSAPRSLSRLSSSSSADAFFREVNILQKRVRLLLIRRSRFNRCTCSLRDRVIFLDSLPPLPPLHHRA